MRKATLKASVAKPAPKKTAITWSRSEPGDARDQDGGARGPGAARHAALRARLAAAPRIGHAPDPVLACRRHDRRRARSRRPGRRQPLAPARGRAGRDPGRHRVPAHLQQRPPVRRAGDAGLEVRGPGLRRGAPLGHAAGAAGRLLARLARPRAAGPLQTRPGGRHGPLDPAGALAVASVPAAVAGLLLQDEADDPPARAAAAGRDAGGLRGAALAGGPPAPGRRGTRTCRAGARACWSARPRRSRSCPACRAPASP